jgi:hypothetical protein
MRKIKLNAKIASGLTVLAISGGWLAGATLGTPSVSSASTSPSTSISAALSSFSTTSPSGGHHGGLMRVAAGGHLLKTAASDLNTTTTALKADLHSGKTLAALATAANISPSTLISELVTSATANINSAVTAGKITSTQATQMLSHLNTAITNFVNNPRPTGGPGGHGGPGFGGPNGGAALGSASSAGTAQPA